MSAELTIQSNTIAHIKESEIHFKLILFHFRSKEDSTEWYVPNVKRKMISG